MNITLQLDIHNEDDRNAIRALLAHVENQSVIKDSGLKTPDEFITEMHRIAESIEAAPSVKVPQQTTTTKVEEKPVPVKSDTEALIPTEYHLDGSDDKKRRTLSSFKKHLGRERKEAADATMISISGTKFMSKVDPSDYSAIWDAFADIYLSESASSEQAQIIDETSPVISPKMKFDEDDTPAKKIRVLRAMAKTLNIEVDSEALDNEEYEKEYARLKSLFLQDIQSYETPQPNDDDQNEVEDDSDEPEDFGVTYDDIKALIDAKKGNFRKEIKERIESYGVKASRLIEPTDYDDFYNFLNGL